MQKLITDVCRKTAFGFNSNIYKKADGITMGSSLGPLIANIFMTECALHENCPNTELFLVRIFPHSD